MFLHVSVILSIKGSLYDVTSCVAACSHVPSGERTLSLVPCSFQRQVSAHKGSVQGVLVQEISVQGGVSVGRPPKIQKSGRYASNWNAFLLSDLIKFRCNMRTFYFLIRGSKNSTTYL